MEGWLNPERINRQWYVFYQHPKHVSGSKVPSHMSPNEFMDTNSKHHYFASNKYGLVSQLGEIDGVDDVEPVGEIRVKVIIRNVYQDVDTKYYAWGYFYYKGQRAWEISPVGVSVSEKHLSELEIICIKEAIDNQLDYGAESIGSMEWITVDFGVD